MDDDAQLSAGEPALRVREERILFTKHP